MNNFFSSSRKPIPKDNKIMVIGNSVATVQNVSRHCLELKLEVFPYYGVPSFEEIKLFSPKLLILCLPLIEQFIAELKHPYIFWSDSSQYLTSELPLFSSRQELESYLKKIFTL